MSTQHQPTILVKKADGTSERITLEEFRARKNNASSQSDISAPQASVRAPSSDQQTQVLSQSSFSAQNDASSDEPPKRSETEKKNLTVTQLLAELQKHQLPVQSASDQYNLKSELQKAGKIPAPKNQTAEQGQQTIKKSQIDPAQVAEKLRQQQVRSVSTNSTSELFSSPLQSFSAPQKTNVSQTQPNWEQDDHSSLLEEPFETPSQEPLQVDQTKTEKSVSNQDVFLTKNLASASPPVPIQKPVIHDIMPSEQRGHGPVGPVEEIAQFDIQQFRALGHSVEEAKQLFFQKFSLLKKESYLLFMDAKKAWHKSPLFLQYRNTVVTALSAHQPLQEFIGTDAKGIDLTKEEFDAFIWINNQLSYS